MSNIRKWADEHQYVAAPMQANRTDEENIVPTVHLLNMTPDPLGAVAAACRMYEGKPTYDLADITDAERVRYFEQVQKTHLKAPLEFIDLHFFIEGVTRSFTHQMVRQRTAVYAQESLRFAVKEESWADVTSLPPSLAATKGTWDEGKYNDDLEFQRSVWDDAIAASEAAYKTLVEAGIPAEDARGLMPHAMTTRLNYKTNLRNLGEHAGNRLCTQAQFEWRIVFMGIVNAIRNYDSSYRVEGRQPDSDWQLEMIADSGIFRPICYQLGRCQFNADFDRSCTIRTRVDAHAAHGTPSAEWRKDIDPAEWLADPAAARKTSGGAGHD